MRHRGVVQTMAKCLAMVRGRGWHRLSDPSSSKSLALSEFLHTVFWIKLNLASLTNKSLKKSSSRVSKAISKASEHTTHSHNGASYMRIWCPIADSRQHKLCTADIFWLNSCYNWNYFIKQAWIISITPWPGVLAVYMMTPCWLN